MTVLPDGPVWLVGLPGAGKSTLGPLLARRLRRTFVDLDPFIEKRAGQAIPAIFHLQGEAAFRHLEEEALIVLAAEHEKALVVACGGGVISHLGSRHCLASRGVVLWLDVPWKLAQQRCRAQPLERPLLADPAVFARRLPERLIQYRRLGQRIDASGTVRQVLNRMLEVCNA